MDILYIKHFFYKYYFWFTNPKTWRRKNKKLFQWRAKIFFNLANVDFQGERFSPCTKYFFPPWECFSSMNMWFICYTCKLCFVLISETFLRMLLGWDWKQLLPSAPANPRADWCNGGSTPADSDGNRRPEAWARKASRCQNIFRKRNWNVLQTNRWGRKVNINLWKTWITHRLGFLSVRVNQYCILEFPALKNIT